MRKVMFGWLAGMTVSLLLAPGARAQGWVEHERKDAYQTEYRITSRKPGGVVEADTRSQCLPNMKETEYCLGIILEGTRSVAGIFHPRGDVPVDKRVAGRNPTARYARRLIIDCPGKRYNEPLTEFLDAKGEVLTRVRPRTPKWIAWDKDFTLGPKVCK